MLGFFVYNRESMSFLLMMFRMFTANESVSVFGVPTRQSELKQEAQEA